MQTTAGFCSYSLCDKNVIRTSKSSETLLLYELPSSALLSSKSPVSNPDWLLPIETLLWFHDSPSGSRVTQQGGNQHVGQVLLRTQHSHCTHGREGRKNYTPAQAIEVHWVGSQSPSLCFLPLRKNPVWVIPRTLLK